MLNTIDFQPMPKALDDLQDADFCLESSFQPAGSQPNAIQAILGQLAQGKRNMVLLGVTGSGKTFTMAHVISKWKKPTLILAPNKTLAAQLYGEMKSFFPHNAVEYFVSYYDYYRPEAYLPQTNTYIAKEATINEHIERMRHGATRALLERRDVIVVASVSCIYGLGAIESYQGMSLALSKGQQNTTLSDIARKLSQLQYQRNEVAFKRGTFRVRGDRIDVFPAHYEDRAWRIVLFGPVIEEIYEIDALTGQSMAVLPFVTIYPNNHYVTPGPTVAQAIVHIRKELDTRVQEFQQEGRLLEAQRLRERVTYDLETLASTGICAGIENYSCYLTGRPIGQPPPTLFEYLPPDALFIVDESHVAVPQLRGMYLGDASRKKTLSVHGFRLPSCRHNRPLTFDEWDQMRPATLFVSATPGPWELQQGEVIEQVIRPTGLLDPVGTVHPSEGQVDHLIQEIRHVVQEKGRVLVTTLTKKMAQDLAEYLSDASLKVRYMHCEIDTLERIEIIKDLRKGFFDVLVGINLLREGLDIPECQLVAILDADKEGYLRSKTSLIQTMGRAARHVAGRVLLYADTITHSLKEALAETHRRRMIQQAHNEKYGIVPRSVKSAVPEISYVTDPIWDNFENFSLEELKAEMAQAAENLDFEKALLLQKALSQRSTII